MRPLLITLVAAYWIIIVITFSAQLDSPFVDDGYTTTGNFSEVVSDEPTGNILTDILGILALALFGVGLPASVPFWMQLIFVLWSVLVDIVFVVGLIS